MRDQRVTAAVGAIFCVVGLVCVATSGLKSVSLENNSVYQPCVGCDDAEKNFLKGMNKNYEGRKSILEEADSITSSAGMSKSDDAFLEGLKEGIAKRGKELEDLYVVRGPESPDSSSEDQKPNPDLATPDLMSKSDQAYIDGLQKQISDRKGQLKDLYKIDDEAAKDSDAQEVQVPDLATPALISKKDASYVDSLKKAIADRAGQLQDMFKLPEIPKKREEGGESESESQSDDLSTVTLSKEELGYVKNLKQAIETRAKALREMESSESATEPMPKLANTDVQGVTDSVIISPEEQAEVDALKAKTVEAGKSLAQLSDQGFISSESVVYFSWNRAGEGWADSVVLVCCLRRFGG